MTDTTHDPDDPRYTTIHGGVQLPNTHDEFCPLTRHPGWDHGVYCRCDLIARVRADERERAAERVGNNIASWFEPINGWLVVSHSDAVAAARGGG